MKPKHRLVLAASVSALFISLSIGAVKLVQAQTNPWTYQTKTYSNYQPLSGYGGSIYPGGSLTGTLQSDDFPFVLTPGNYTATLNSGTFDDRGYVGGLSTNKPGSSCGAPATYQSLPTNIPNVSVVGKRLQVDISAYDACPQNIGWKNVSVTWAAKQIPCTLTISPATTVPGGTVTINGANFASSGNNILFTNNSDPAKSQTFNNVPSPDTTSMTIPIPESSYSGSYTVSIPTAPSCTTASLQIKPISDAPSNLMASIDKTGIIKLNWVNNSTRQVDVVIQGQQNISDGFVPIVSTTDPSDSSDSIITGYPTTPTQRFRVVAEYPDGSLSGPSNVATVSNCVLVSGNGPRKIVFMRGKSLTFTTKEYLAQVQNEINNGFAAVEPFRSNIGQFSFYVDLTSYDDSQFDMETESGGPGQPDYLFFSESSDAKLLAGSACAPNNASEYIFHESISNVYPAYTQTKYKIAFLNFLSSGRTITPLIVMHESGHAFAGLIDEYDTTHSASPEDSTGDLSGFTKDTDQASSENCTASPFQDYSGLDNHIYASVTDTGCSYMLSSHYSSDRKYSPTIYYYRPSANSIMDDDHDTYISGYNQFNVISCGYILAVIHGAKPTSLTRDDAAPYWPTCLNMAQQGSVMDDGIPPANPTAIASKISDKTLSPSSDPSTVGISRLSSKAAPANVTITGSNFSTAYPNTVRLSNALSSSIYYEIPNLSSPDGKTLSFSLPDSIPLGKYDLQVGAFNSDWSKPIVVTVLPAGGAPAKGAPVPPPTIPPLYDFGGMYGGNPNNVNPATGSASCPSGYGSVTVYDGLKAGGNPAYSLYVCMRAHVAGQDPLYDFGGIYETAAFLGAPHDLNPATGKTSCPAGFLAAQADGGNAATDGGWNFCYSPYSANHYYNFGGMYGTSANIVTGAKSCPAGYTKLAMSAFPVTYCYQPMYAPPAPPVLKAAALSASQIQLSWTISSAQGLSSYTLHDYSTGQNVYDGNGDLILHVNTDGIPNTATSFIVPSLAARTQYCFSLKANALYDVKESNSACATTKAATASPAQASLPDQNPVTTIPAPVNPVQAPTAPTAPTLQSPNLAPISGPTQLSVGDIANWRFGASDPQGSAMTYSMSFGDSSPASSSAVPSFKHSYAAPGAYTVTAYAKDAAGLTGQTTLAVLVASAAPSAPTAPAAAVAPAITASLDPSSPSGTVGILTSAPTPNVPILVFDVKSTVSGSLQTAVINLIPSVRGGTTPLGPQKVFFAIQLQAAGRAYSPSSVTAAGVVFSNMQIPLSAGQSVPVTVLVTAPQDTADGFFNGTVASPQVNPANLAATDASGQAIPPSGASVVGNTLTFSTQVSFISGSSLTANLHDGFSAWLQSVIGW